MPRRAGCAIAALVAVAHAAVADSRSDYLLHCSGCHMPDGSGLPPVVPTLVGTLGVMIRTEEGRGYVVRVPGSAQSPLSDDALADVINWLLLEFNRHTLPEEFRPLDGAEVGIARRQVLADPVKLRNELWPNIDAR